MIYFVQVPNRSSADFTFQSYSRARVVNESSPRAITAAKPIDTSIILFFSSIRCDAQ